MIRTPRKSPNRQTNSDGEPQKSPPKTMTLTSKVRKSIGEWEAAKTEAITTSPLTSYVNQAGPAKIIRRKALSQESAPTRKPPPATQNSPKENLPEKATEVKVYRDRTAEARACLNSAKLHLNNSRNLKTDIKTGVVHAIDRLYQLVKEAEAEHKGKGKEINEGEQKTNSRPRSNETVQIEQDDLRTRLEEHSRLLLENNKKMVELKASMEKQLDNLERRTYSSVTANPAEKRQAERVALHSIIVTSEDETVKGEEVLGKVREAIDAKEGWITVERVRKARDRKIIMSCRTEEDRSKIKKRIESAGKRLICEEVSNKDPLLILKGVLQINSDADVLQAMRKQNQHIFRDIDPKEDRIEIKYQRRARNPLTRHVIVSTSPTVWKKLTETGMLYINLQRIKVEDQSPLVQCTRCLGFGHGKRFCKETIDLCSHCAGPHLRAECPDWREGNPPTCKNCVAAKQDQNDHNAFSQECPARKRWDVLARSSVAYC